MWDEHQNYKEPRATSALASGTKLQRQQLPVKQYVFLANYMPFFLNYFNFFGPNIDDLMYVNKALNYSGFLDFFFRKAFQGTKNNWHHYFCFSNNYTHIPLQMQNVRLQKWHIKNNRRRYFLKPEDAGQSQKLVGNAARR